MKERMLRLSVRALLLAGCAVGLTSCGTIGSILSYLINLPLNLLQAVRP